MLGSILRLSENSEICDRAHELGVLRLRPILGIGDRRSAIGSAGADPLATKPYVYTRLGLQSGAAGDGVISLLGGARVNYSRLRRGATATERHVVPADSCLTVPKGKHPALLAAFFPLIFLLIYLYLWTSFAATPFYFQTHAFYFPTRLSFATILYHCEQRSTRQDSPRCLEQSPPARVSVAYHKFSGLQYSLFRTVVSTVSMPNMNYSTALPHSNSHQN